jgi:uncharacterized surface protein with fasciclin (FAS1) repeats
MKKLAFFGVTGLLVIMLAVGSQTMSAMGYKKNIVETAVSAGSFNTLVTAVKAAGLVDALSGPGPLTVFAPNDDAFATLPAGTIDALLQDKDKLTAVLTYHVVSGKYMADDVVGTQSLTTLNGQNLTIAVKDGKVMIDGAQVIATDIVCSNGVIHVINSPVLPK